jgi:glycosyltransferase involved in cell wall biosynthesis
MRVTHIITRLIVGGAQENTVSSVLGLIKKPGLEVRLISGPSEGPEGRLDGAFESLPGVLETLPELVRPVSPPLDLVALKKLTLMLRAERPDIVHTHSGKAGVLGRLAAAKAGVPVIIHTIHGPSFGPFQGPLANFVFAAAEKYAARVTTHFVVVADAMRDQYLAGGIGRPGQYTTVLSGFDLDPFLNARNDTELRKRLNIAEDDLVIGKIARITDLKGHADLVECSREILGACPSVKFLFVGDGDLRPSIEARIRELGLSDRFVFAGLVKPGEVCRYVGVMDVVAHLSRREGLPRALPQALAAGKPVVAYDCDGSREACLDGRTGVLLSTGDRKGLVRALARLGTDAGLRAKLGSEGRGFVASRFGVQKMVDDLHDLYLRLRSK